MKTSGKTKATIAYDYLKKLIESDQIQPGDLLPTEIELGKTLGINRLTVAKALGSLENEGFVERQAGRGTTLLRKPASSSSKMLLVISPWPSLHPKDDWYFSRLLYSIQAESFRNGISTINTAFHYSESDQQDFSKIRDLYQAVECAGAIVVDPFMATHDRLIQLLDKLGCPAVWAGSSLHSYENAHRVDIDNFKAASELTGKLVADGAQQIIFMSGALNTTARMRRFEGYKAALEEHGIPFDERLVICHSTPSYMNEAGSECAGIYAARRLNADAIFLNDFPMIDGIHEFCDRYPGPELNNLKTLPIATFDYEEHEKEKGIRYSVSQPIEEIGKEAVQIFLQTGNAEPSIPPVVKILEPVIQTFSAEI